MAFRLLDNAEELMIRTVMITTHSPKKYRQNVVHQMQEYTKLIYEYIYFANEYRDDKTKCMDYQKEAYVYIKMMNNILDRAERIQCITISEEAELGKLLATVQTIFEGWMSSDKKKK